MKLQEQVNQESRTFKCLLAIVLNKDSNIFIIIKYLEVYYYYTLEWCDIAFVYLTSAIPFSYKQKIKRDHKEL
jgi:hypothetical protein